MADPVGFSVTVEETRAGPIVMVRGEVDVATVAQMDEAIGRALPSVTDRLVLDLSACSYMDSSGITVLLRARKQLPEGAALVLRRPDRRVVQVLEITKVDTLVTIEDP
jgi:anti-sigma B factor antagonist